MLVPNDRDILNRWTDFVDPRALLHIYSVGRDLAFDQYGASTDVQLRAALLKVLNRIAGSSQVRVRDCSFTVWVGESDNALLIGLPREVPGTVDAELQQELKSTFGHAHRSAGTAEELTPAFRYEAGNLFRYGEPHEVRSGVDPRRGDSAASVSGMPLEAPAHREAEIPVSVPIRVARHATAVGRELYGGLTSGTVPLERTEPHPSLFEQELQDTGPPIGVRKHAGRRARRFRAVLPPLQLELEFGD